MEVVTGAFCEPSSDLGMFVGSVVVDDEMDVERLGEHRRLAQVEDEMPHGSEVLDLGSCQAHSARLFPDSA